MEWDTSFVKFIGAEEQRKYSPKNKTGRRTTKQRLRKKNM